MHRMTNHRKLWIAKALMAGKPVYLLNCVGTSQSEVLDKIWVGRKKGDADLPDQWAGANAMQIVEIEFSEVVGS